MNFQLDRYHNLHFSIFKRLNRDELMQELNQHVGKIFHRVFLIFQFFKLTVAIINLLSRGWNSSLVFLLLQSKSQLLKQNIKTDP